MSFGASYEMIITVFVVLFGLLFIVLGYHFLAIPFIQLSFLFGVFLILLGWAKNNYDTFYTGILLIIIPLILLSVLPTFGISQSVAEAGLLYAILPILSVLQWLYNTHPIIFAAVIILLAYGIMKK